MDKKFKVKAFQFILGTKGKENGMSVRTVIELGKNLSWQDAKKLRKENRDSWIIKE